MARERDISFMGVPGMGVKIGRTLVGLFGRKERRMLRRFIIKGEERKKGEWDLYIDKGIHTYLFKRHFY